MQSPETYIGYAKAWTILISLPAKDKPHLYTAPGPYGRNQWGLTGTWTIGA